MYKKLLFSLVMMAVGFSASYAQETLTVYDGDATNAYVPVYGFYADAFTKVEFIMDYNELSAMTGGTISSLTWYLATPAEAVWGGRFQIFVKEVTESTIYQYMGMDGATLVYDGPLDGTGEELEIVFATPYAYNGGNLLIGVYGVEKGTYKSATFAGETVEGASLQGYSYSDLDGITGNQRDFLPKTTFTFAPSGGVVYYKPTNVLASEITPNSALITWTPGSTETAWNVEYRIQGEEEWMSAGSVDVPTIVLDVLQNGTPYEVRVQADYGEGNLSGWTTAKFTTLVCDDADMGEITYILEDSYGDGWNGNKLQIVYHNTGALIAEVTIPAGENYLEGTINVCYGEDYDLVWVNGSYAYECSFQVLDPNGEPIFEHVSTGSSGPVPTPGVLTTFAISRDGCARPNDLVATDIVYNGATLTWTPADEEQDLWQVVYGTGSFDPNEVEPINVNGAPTLQLTGLQENTAYTAYVRAICTADNMSRWSKPCAFSTPLRFPLPTDLAVDKISAKSAEATWNGNASGYNLRYRVKTNLDESFESVEIPSGWMNYGNWEILPINDYNMGGVPLYAQEGYSCLASISMDENTGAPLGVDEWLISPKASLGGMLTFYAMDLGANYVENYSVYVSMDGEEFIALEENIATPGALNVWDKKEYDLSAYAGQQGYIAFRHHDAAGYYLFIDAVSIAGEGVALEEWTVIENATSPAAMAPLAPGTTYEVQVQGVFAEGESQWTPVVVFTTLPADAMPTNLEVIDVTATTADVTWTGSQDVYNLRYRTAAVLNGVNEDFTGYNTGDIPTGWTMLDSDGDGQTWYVWNLTLEDGTVQTTLSSNSYLNNYGPLTPDNWAITPQVKLGEVVQFDAWGQDPSWAAEHFRVYVSTTGTDAADFVPISEEIIATGVQTTYSFDLGQYAGQMGYIAIRHYNITDMYVLNVTNFYLAGEEDDVPAGEWIVINNVTPPYTIEGLTPETTYEVQVQGVLGDRATTQWTNSVLFTTLEEQVVPPTEQTAAPSISADTQNGVHAYFVTVTPSEESDIYYRYSKDNGEWSDWILYDGVVPFEEDGYYQVEAYAIANGKSESLHVSVSFVVTPRTGLDELSGDKAVTSVRYFNVAGQEMAQPEGMTIVVTTYNDGTTVATKVIK